jgi:hypothetical protein
VLTRRAFLSLAVGSVVAVGDAVTAGQDMARSVLAGMRAALRSTIVRALEPQTGSWVNNNLWGEQRFEPLPSRPGSVVSVLPKNTKLFGPPAVHSIQLGRSDAVDAENADVYARITLGCGGIENQFDVDWVHGAQFSVTCNSLSVQAVTYAPHGDGDYNAAGAAVALKVMVAKGSVHQGRCPATYTMPAAGLFANRFFNVPDFAREFCLHVGANNDPQVPTQILMHFRNEGGTDLAVYDAQVCAGGRSVPLPGGCNTLFIDKLTAASPICTPQFFLGF